MDIFSIFSHFFYNTCCIVVVIILSNVVVVVVVAVVSFKVLEIDFWKRRLGKIWISWWYFWSLLGSEGASGVTDGWCITPEGEWGGKNHSNFTGDRFQVIVPLFTCENGGLLRFGYLGGILGQFGALRGAPEVTEGVCSNPRRGWDTTNQRGFTGDRF